MSKIVEPYKLLGEPSTWGAFGSDQSDEAIELERRLLCDYFAKRLKRLDRKGVDGGEATANILTATPVALLGVMIASAGGVSALPEDMFDRWIAIATFAWHQAIGIADQGAGHA